MKKTIKKLFALVLVVGLVFSFAGCAKMNFVTNKTIGAMKAVRDGSWKNAETTDAPTEGTDDATVSVVEAFKPDTYGGIEFKTEEDVAKYYVEAYNKTKAKTSTYINSEGKKEVWYDFLGNEKLTIEAVLIEGKQNGMIDKIVPTIVKQLFAATPYGLPPCDSRNPDSDPWAKSNLTVEDIQSCNVAENADGTITITIQPKAGSSSLRGKDSQGRFFNVLGDIAGTVDQIDVLSWSTGETEDNVLVDYAGGTGKVTIDPKTGEITTADYHMVVDVNVKHANVTVIKDKNASVKISYDMHFPCDDQFLMDSKKASRA